MSSEVDNLTPISGRHDLIDALALGCKGPSQWRLGTEHEKFPFYIADRTPVPYAGPHGIRALFEDLSAQTSGELVFEEGHPIALKLKGGASVTLEPGGQFELSGGALADVHGTAAELEEHLSTLGAISKRHGIAFLGAGFCPTWTIPQIPRMPRQRYRVMEKKVFAHGPDIMYRTSTVQVNLDFASEADMVRKLRASLSVQPILTAMMAASPFWEGKPSGFVSTRARCWQDFDPLRTGQMPFVFETGFGFEHYVDWALGIPLYFVKRGEVYHDGAGSTFADLLAGRFAPLAGEPATMGDWENHLSTLFPEVRIKKFLEMRGSDCSSRPLMLACAAFWAGLLYHDASLQSALDLVRPWQVNDRANLLVDVASDGLRATVGGQSVGALAHELLCMARAGCEARARMNERGEDESIYLEPLFRIVNEGESLADRWLSAYRGRWKGSLDPFFDEAIL